MPPSIAYLIFFAWDIVGIVTIWIFVVETKQLSLEDMDEIFIAKNPKKRSFELARDAKERAKRDREDHAGVNHELAV
jgi:hypothetical protein